MNIISNETLIRRNARIGQVAMIGGLGILVAGMILSYRNPELIMLSWGALILGFLLSQIGFYFSNRWGRRPRPDELLDQGLKGLDKKYSLYHYSSPIAHLLVGPAGIWVLQPYALRGRITYSKGRWRHQGGNIFLKFFGQENLGRPDIELLSELEKLEKFFKQNLPDVALPDLQAALVFTNPEITIDIPEGVTPPAETVTLKKLKDTIRKAAKVNALSMEKVEQVQNLLGGE